MNEITNAQAKEALKAVFRKASTDPSFRAKCLSDPTAAIEEVSGISVPAGLQIKFAEPGQGYVITLPPLNASEDSLEENALASIAGGGQQKAGDDSYSKSYACISS